MLGDPATESDLLEQKITQIDTRLDRFVRLLDILEKLLNRTSQKLLEQPIHEMLTELDERQKLTKKYTFGGVSPKVLHHE